MRLIGVRRVSRETASHSDKPSAHSDKRGHTDGRAAGARPAARCTAARGPRTARAGRLKSEKENQNGAHGSDLSRRSSDVRSPSSHAHTAQGPPRAGAAGRGAGRTHGRRPHHPRRPTPALRAHGPPRLPAARALPAALRLFPAHDAEFGAAPLAGHCSLSEIRSAAG